jgi:GT2 family glycosyltransferase
MTLPLVRKVVQRLSGMLEGLSVVIPVKDRTALLARLLESLHKARARHGGENEVIVVDDSGPVAAAMHERNCRAFDAQYVRGPRRVGHKRNVGVQRSRYDIVVFVDSDCEVPEDYLTTVEATLRRQDSSVGAVAGPVEMIGEQTSTLGFFAKTREMNQPFGWAKTYKYITWCACANMAVRRSAFEQVGGFAERTLTVVGGEDVDLGVRLTINGAAVLCDPDAVIYHTRATGDDVGSIFRRLFMYGRASNWLITRHPDRYDLRLNPVSALVVGALVAAASAKATRGGSITLATIAAGGLVGTHAWRRRASGGGVRDLRDAVLCTFLDWSFDLGEFVGSFQVGRPHYMFRRFRFQDAEGFIERGPAPEATA